VWLANCRHGGVRISLWGQESETDIRRFSGSVSGFRYCFRLSCGRDKSPPPTFPWLVPYGSRHVSPLLLPAPILPRRYIGTPTALDEPSRSVQTN
jgi:hypothetical protein